ncbi:MAG: cbb3-type cytochrome c oxidase subunit I [Candidatus Thermoplasmatota archaeon]|nr:cbb3-type cytochrome c oxidase subunit I [Candidatus Thermoplasmatota archaeon]
MNGGMITAQSSTSIGQTSFLFYITLIISISAIVLLIIFYYISTQKTILKEKAESMGYESPNEMVRDKLAGKPRLLSWNVFLYDDSKSIALRYLLASMVFFFIAGSFGLGMRLSLTNPNPHLLTPDEYNVLLSEHAILMIYMFALGAAFFLGYYLLPSHLKLKRDVMGGYASVAFWIWLFGGIFILVSRTATRWYYYPPLALELAEYGGGVFNWLAVIGLEMVFVGVVINCIIIIKLIASERSKDIKLSEMSLFTWAMLFTVVMTISSAPTLMVGLGMLFYDFFNPIFFTAASHQVLLFTIMFWFWGHPIVYIAIIPAFGLIYEIIPKFTGKPIYSYNSGIIGLGLLLILSELVWGHHLMNSGLGVAWDIFFGTTSFLVVIPSAITVFNWIASLWSADRIRLTTPMLFVINGIIDFIIGGTMGVILSAAPANDFLHGTYFVTGHFHFIFLGLTVGITFAGIYMLFPTLTGGRKYDVRLARWHFYLTALGSAVMAGAWGIGGFMGMPRATAGYFARFQPYQDVSIAGGIIIAIAQLIFLYNLAKSYTKQPSISMDNVLENNPTSPEIPVTTPAPTPPDINITGGAK